MIGAGSSLLVDDLAVDHHVVAVDISDATLDSLRERLPDEADVEWVVADVCALVLDEPVDVWHDRATFHFLGDVGDQHRYAQHAAAAIAPGGHLVIATFAPTGPEQCSGLDVCRHDTDSLGSVFGHWFDLVESFELDHVTPWDATQRFTHAVFRRR